MIEGMKLTVESASPATVEQIYASHIQQAVREEACRQSGALSFEVAVTPTADGGAEVRVDRVMAPDVPDFIRSFVGESISIRQVEQWTAPDAQGTRRGAIRITIKNQPASMVAEAVLTNAGSGSKLVVAGDVKVAIPIFGRKVEPQIVKVIESALRIEQRVDNQHAQEAAR